MNTANNSLNPATITITLSRTQTSTNYRFGYSIQDINYQISLNKLNYTLRLSSTTATAALLDFYTNNANHLILFSISYLVIEPLFGNYYFSSRWLKPNQNLAPNTNYTETSNTEGPFNTSANFSLWITIVGLEASMGGTN